MLDGLAPRTWAFHESFSAFHEPASTPKPPHEPAFTVRTSYHPLRPAASAKPEPTSHSDSRKPGPVPDQPARSSRRLMYDPVRDATSSRLPDSPAPAASPVPAPRTYQPLDLVSRPAGQSRGTTHVDRLVSLIPSPHLDDESDHAPWLRYQVRDSLSAADPTTPVELPFGPHRPRLPPILPPEHTHSATAAIPHRDKPARTRFTWGLDRRSSKRAYVQLDGSADRRTPSQSSRHADADTKQSPAFRLDNLLEHSPSESSASVSRSSPAAASLRALHSSAPPYVQSPVFPGKLPPPPFTGSAAFGSAAHTPIGHLGLSVSKDVNLGAFATADDFEREAFAQPDSLPTAHTSSLTGSSASGSKPARRVAASRRRSRLFPHDDVPLVISSTTTKQSRYRPSGDRQPVACGYKDPITQIQCDEPFNRPVELRRHVRAVHVPAEALAVTMGQLSRSQAILLPNDWKPGDGGVLRPTCLCGKVFSRLDALRRHWTGVNAKVVDGKCVECPSSLARNRNSEHSTG